MRDIESFRTKINSSAAPAMATTRGSDLQKKTRADKTVVTKQKYQMCESQICYCRTKHWRCHVEQGVLEPGRGSGTGGSAPVCASFA